MKKKTAKKRKVGPGPHGLGYWPDGTPVKSGSDALLFQQTAGGRLAIYPKNAL